MQTENTFEYEKSEVKLKHGTKYIEKITFAIDRFGNFTQTIKFSKKKTERKFVWYDNPVNVQLVSDFCERFLGCNFDIPIVRTTGLF